MPTNGYDGPMMRQVLGADGHNALVLGEQAEPQHRPPAENQARHGQQRDHHGAGAGDIRAYPFRLPRSGGQADQGEHGRAEAVGE
jgi:hypothetical protein